LYPCELLLRNRPTKGPTTCPIHIEIGNERFPNAMWDDFAVVIMGWWIEQVIELRSGTSSVALWDFMDGPYSLEIQRSHEDCCIVNCIMRGVKGSKVIARREVSLKQITQEIIEASESLLGFIKKAAVWDNDSQKLESILSRVKDTE
jgi:hypothetical protein